MCAAEARADADAGDVAPGAPGADGAGSLVGADAAAGDAEPPAATPRRRDRGGLRWAPAVLLLLAASLGVRLWGAHHGLPYAYNADENAHFVTKAIGLFGHDANPHYFVNPPAYTYLLHAVFAVVYGDRASVSETFATDPGSVFLVGRVVCAALGTLSVWLLYLAGAKLFGDRRVGFVAAAVLAVAFLPVFYAHLALNDVPTLAPICLALYGAARVLHGGRLRDYLLAGAGLGLACATKYTGGIVLLPIVAAGAGWLITGRGPRAAAAPPAGGAGEDGGGDGPGTERRAAALRRRRRRTLALAGLVLAGLAALAAFFVANPYAFLDLHSFREGLNHQSTVADDALGKLGQTADNGLAYYLWTLTWGLGWAPAVAAAAGVVLVARDAPRVAALLVPAPVLFILFMGMQQRWFGRWLMPVFPLLCLLAAYAAVRLAVAASRRRPAVRPALLTLAALGLCGQGIVTSIHIGSVLSHADTRNMARAWMVRNVPAHTKVVVEPVVPDGWATDVGHPSPVSSNGYRWVKFPTSRSHFAPDGSRLPGPGRIVNIEDYERTLRPALVQQYLRQGYCWVVSGFSQRGRAEAQPRAVPQALAYYRALERHADLAYRATPYRRGAQPVRFGFDWTFDYYPRAYYRPGPTMWIYHLHGGECGPARRAG